MPCFVCNFSNCQWMHHSIFSMKVPDCSKWPYKMTVWWLVKYVCSNIYSKVWLKKKKKHWWSFLFWLVMKLHCANNYQYNSLFSLNHKISFLPLLVHGLLCLLQEAGAYFSETYHLLTMLKVTPLFEPWKWPSLDEELISQTQVCCACFLRKAHKWEGVGWQLSI